MALWPLTCAYCGKVIVLPWWVARRRKYCSRECGLAATGFPVRGNSYSYGTEWRKVKKAALERDHHTCTQCGATEKLHVHHIIPYRVSAAHILDNLTTLCASCHTAIHSAELLRIRWAQKQGSTQVSSD